MEYRNAEMTFYAQEQSISLLQEKLKQNQNELSDVNPLTGLFKNVETIKIEIAQNQASLDNRVPALQGIF